LKCHYLLSLGPLILGHRHPRVAARVAEETARLGAMFALPYELEQHVARKFLAAVPSAEMVRFTNSGSEAVGATVRLARAATGRPRLMSHMPTLIGPRGAFMASYPPMTTTHTGS
jgi:glutamate-1-semialdehyde aminotransferase